ncbi:alpha-ketoacid dehydrogenase subunit alpha/beta [Parafilimonas terrae]|uniref:3-methyl-2-oxobutanoate dehydrogenase (2-methylpropanoyl-transferring) n=1 Tax=Parafilimonas terrae TaxID=1465490 RepID=A0A1I5YII1_9BACT|nr:alpha-ketoacid dehydrogenase subunit alpha/beta [Parafilimonas terrae]SFQ44034.1 2-oxoisovalerate dehydrogenase E1 component [Parafilimonas terrae]
MLDNAILAKAFRLMVTARCMADIYEANRQVCKYVHSTSKGHEALQIATGLQLLSCDFVSPYYRDDSLLLSLGFTPYQLMLQLLAKADDPFSGGRSYYAHASSNAADKPKIIHQSSATGMQAIPTTGIAQGVKHLEQYLPHLLQKGSNNENPVVVCSFGDYSITEGEVSEALQFAVLKHLPVIYLVQDNEWGISTTAREGRAMNAFDFAMGYKGLERLKVDGSVFEYAYGAMNYAIDFVRRERKPILVHAKVPLLNHHTSGVRKEFYRSKEDLERHQAHDPYLKLKNYLFENDFVESHIGQIEKEVFEEVQQAFEKAKQAEDPSPASVSLNVFAETPVKEERGTREPANGEKILMVDAGLHAIEELMQDDERCLLYGQDVGKRLGGVFRETATLADKFGMHRVFNTAIQEAYIIGSTAGMSAVGLKPVVEVQFGDYIYPGLNQLVCEIAKSNYLTNGKYPVSMVLRVPVGAYGGGGPYHSGCVESTLLSIKGIKVCYPSNAADMKGLMKAAYYDPNPVVILEHKGLYWSKVPGTEDAKTIEPAKDYILPLGKGNIILQADEAMVSNGESVCIITYGMGVYWAKTAALYFKGNVEIIDLRTLYPMDEALVFSTVKKHGKCLVLTEEQQTNSFAEALAHRISYNCFTWLDAPVEVFGALDLPAVPINIVLENAMLPTVEKIKERIEMLLNK